METINKIKELISEKVRSLSPEKQQTILDFAEFLAQRSQAPAKRQWSSDFLGTFGAWVGEPLERPEQGEFEVREPLF